jgi:hypothetical protein
MPRQEIPQQETKDIQHFCVIILILCTTSFLDRYCHVYVGARDENSGF